ncbi:probable disease resistance protein At1g58602 [Pistacia vera]|uniref:probable disease resistance protein At1g58602 n=1 Tax=Pistacia vera TaxID=55513 RepID=UPI00126356C1|nr:probable disease resistance protein At1g58602 [Pistacia vera]
MVLTERCRLKGRTKTCRLKNDIYDLLCPMSERMGYFHLHPEHSHSKNKSPNFIFRTLVANADIKKNSFSDRQIQHLRSYISFNCRKKGKPSDETGKFLNKIISRGFGLLTLLDLEGVYKPALPQTLGKNLALLRYVGLRRTFLKKIPESVVHIPCMETLDLKHTLITSLPISIWKAKNLRHLYMHGIYFEIETFGYEFPTNLQTLCGLMIGDNSPTINWLKRFKDLWKLGLICHTESINQIVYWISQMTGLRSLRLKSVNDSSKPSSLHIPITISGIPNTLTNLYLVGEMSLFGEIFFVPNLRVLTLSASQLTHDPMPILKGLEHLIVLRLFANSYSGKEITCGTCGFPQLQVLKLWMLMELSKWTIKEGAMPALRELEIRHCEKLEKPIGLEEVTTLEKLTLTSMDKDFVDEIKRSVGQNVDDVENHWNFPLFVSSFHPFNFHVNLFVFHYV